MHADIASLKAEADSASLEMYADMASLKADADIGSLEAHRHWQLTLPALVQTIPKWHGLPWRACIHGQHLLVLSPLKHMLYLHADIVRTA